MNSNDYQTCVNLLKNKIFLGHYAGRHRVDEIDEFRDVINLHSSEDQLQNDISTLLKTVHDSGSPIWVAMSDSSKNGAYSLWVQLDGIAFGHYWFQIKHVRLTGRQLFCVVSVLKKVPAHLVNPTFSFSQGFECAMQSLKGFGNGTESRRSTERNAESEKRNAEREKTNQRSEENASNGRNTAETSGNRESRDRQQNNPIRDARPFSFVRDFRGLTLDQLKAYFSSEELGNGLLKTLLLWSFFTLIYALNSMYECLIILTNIVAVTGDFTIRGIHAVSRLIESLSPIFLGILNLVGKLATGLYILIAMLLGVTPYIPAQQGAPPPRRQAVMYR